MTDLAPGTVTVPVKEALGMAVAVTLHPEEARGRPILPLAHLSSIRPA